MKGILDIDKKYDVRYCIDLWLRDEQIKLAIARTDKRIIYEDVLRPEPVAVVCFGPSLADTWEKVKDFKYIFTCSGSHKFLLERGIVPTWHVEVDPRAHKVQLIGTPHKDVEYLIASTCHPKVFDHLEGFNVKLWHVFDNADDAFRMLPKGDWAITGGSSVGLRAMTMARFFGFTDLHIFGMDGCEGATGKHAAEHPNQPKDHSIVEINGIQFRTTVSMMTCAKQTFHELNQLKDCKTKFYGEGLVQELAKSYVPEHVKGSIFIGISKPETISADYCELNRKLHKDNLAYGVGGGKHAPTVLKLAESLKTHSILDYGSGKGYLAKAIPFPIWEYDPAVPEKSESPRPADLVVCTDVLEHIEPEKLHFVLDDLRRCTKQIGYFVIHTGPSSKTLADGRNSHLIQQNKDWWTMKLKKFFVLAKKSVMESGPLLYCIVSPKPITTTKPTRNMAILAGKQ
jgi:hypothetical protein